MDKKKTITNLTVVVHSFGVVRWKTKHCQGSIEIPPKNSNLSPPYVPARFTGGYRNRGERFPFGPPPRGRFPGHVIYSRATERRPPQGTPLANPRWGIKLRAAGFFSGHFPERTRETFPGNPKFKTGNLKQGNPALRKTIHTPRAHQTYPESFGIRKSTKNGNLVPAYLPHCKTTQSTQPNGQRQPQHGVVPLLENTPLSTTQPLLYRARTIEFGPSVRKLFRSVGPNGNPVQPKTPVAGKHYSSGAENKF